MPNLPIWMTMLFMVFLATTGAGGERPGAVKSETFDRDPGWEGYNNRPDDNAPARVIQDFGYSRTNYARGKLSGEIGGRVVRSSRKAFYAKRLERVATLDDPLHCTGQFVVTETGGTSNVVLGWFNSKTINSSTYVADAMYLRMGGEARGSSVFVNCTTSQHLTVGARVTGFGPRGKNARDFNLIPINTVYTFDLRYDPQGNDGNGQMIVTLGGAGPYTVKNVVVDLRPEHRKAGARFDRFGITNLKAEPGGTLAVYFDDLTLNGESFAFDDDPRWLGQNNRATFDDYLKRGEHDFDYQPNTSFAGGGRGEIGGMMYSNNGAYYADRVGPLTLDDRLVASGRLALTERASEAGLYIGWFNSEGRGYPPKNLIGALIEGPNSVGPMLLPVYGTSNPKIGESVKYGPRIDPSGKQYSWRIEYDPNAASGLGEIRVSLGNETSILKLAPQARRQKALFDRFGLAVFEKGGQWSKVFLDDLQYTISCGAGVSRTKHATETAEPQ